MQARKSIALVFAAVVAAAFSSAALADRYGHRHHRHHHGSRVQLGVGVGVGYGYGYYYGAPIWPGPAYYPYYPYAPAYPPAVVVQSAPRVYIERDEQVAAQERPSSQYWYYCRDSDTYYPYVKQCAAEWERVPARPRSP